MSGVEYSKTKRAAKFDFCSLKLCLESRAAHQRRGVYRGRDASRFHVTREMHAGKHAVHPVFGATRIQGNAFLRYHPGQEYRGEVTKGGMTARVGADRRRFCPDKMH